MLLGPTHVDFNVTNACNLACVHCHSASGRRLNNELTTREIFPVLDQLYELGVLSIAFAGGEPFSRHDIIDILSYACNHRAWVVSVITNGLALEQESIRHELKSRCPNLVINISLDGSNPSSLSNTRRFASPQSDANALFKRVTRSIKFAVEAGFMTSVNYSLTKHTLADLSNTYKLSIDSLGAFGMVAIKFFPEGYGKLHRNDLEIPYGIWSSFFRDLTRLRLAGDFRYLQISVPSAWEFYLPLIEHDIDVGMAEEIWGYRSPLRDTFFSSSWVRGDTSGITELAINSDGTVFPSVLFCGQPQFACGNVRNASLSEIWVVSTILTKIRIISSTTLATPCCECHLQSTCGSGSRARAAVITGTLDAVDPCCPLAASSSDRLLSTCQIRPKTRIERRLVRTVTCTFKGRSFRILYSGDYAEIRIGQNVIHCGRAVADGVESTCRQPEAGVSGNRLTIFSILNFIAAAHNPRVDSTPVASS